MIRTVMFSAGAARKRTVTAGLAGLGQAGSRASSWPGVQVDRQFTGPVQGLPA